MMPKRSIYYGDRTVITAANGVSTGHAMDMHCGHATLRYNAKKHGWAMPGSTGDKAQVFKLNEAVEYIQELAEILN